MVFEKTLISVWEGCIFTYLNNICSQSSEFAASSENTFLPRENIMF